MKVVTDTNVYISALVFRGVAMRVLDQADDGQIELYISPAILHEVLSVMARPKFARTSEQIQEAEAAIRSIAYLIEPKAGIDAVKADPTDNRVIECAIEAHADVIVSEDKHLLRMKSYAGIPIIRIADLLRHERVR